MKENNIIDFNGKTTLSPDENRLIQLLAPATRYLKVKVEESQQAPQNGICPIGVRYEWPDGNVSVNLKTSKPEITLPVIRTENGLFDVNGTIASDENLTEAIDQELEKIIENNK